MTLSELRGPSSSSSSTQPLSPIKGRGKRRKTKESELQTFCYERAYCSTTDDKDVGQGGRQSAPGSSHSRVLGDDHAPMNSIVRRTGRYVPGGDSR